MNHIHSLLLRRICVASAFVVMLVMNVLAVSLPLFGRDTGAISDAYPNLFAPAGYTFSIWSVIYLLMAAYVLYRAGLFRSKTHADTESLLARIDGLAILNFLTNAVWLVSWHADWIWLSVLLMVTLLVTLIRITRILHARPLSMRDMGFLLVPFSVYFGWITVATIANVSTFLVSIGWDGFGISEVVWMNIVLVVGLAIGLTTTIRDRCGAYGLVLIWAYTGILMKHLSETGFNGAYPSVIWTTTICIAAFALGVLYAAWGRVGVLRHAR